MKKLIAVFAVVLFAMATKVSAQRFVARLTTRGNQPIYSVQGLKEGLNTITLPDGKGTITFAKSGNTYRGVTYVNSGTLNVNLEPTQGGTNGAPKPECKSELPDACFASADKNIGMCICKPGNISNGGGETYSIVMVMPAAQRTRVSDGATLQLQSSHH